MSEAHEEFNRLMERVRAGCPEAAREVYEQFSPHIRRVVRRRLHQRLRSQFDSVDFLQAVWASFFLTPPQRYTFAAPEELIGFLGGVALHKVVDAYRRGLRTGKRDLRREKLLTDLEELAPGYEPRDPGPSPSQELGGKEHWERLVAGQPPQMRKILELLRDGHTATEIALESGLHPKVVQRLLRRFYDRGPLS